ncbi:hypothetical protein H9P43_001746 [Blastocladiella emersonii ATCC 22665]|nr:hypothetical protein H9P43_001746 [Blastocladiella emersonii ATCC 22665]
MSSTLSASELGSGHLDGSDPTSPASSSGWSTPRRRRSRPSIHGGSNDGGSGSGTPTSRQWRAVPPPHDAALAAAAEQDPAPPVRIMCYNILADNLLYKNRYLYGRLPESVLQWRYRAPKILAHISENRPDVVCLQEVHHEHLKSDIQPVLERLGYQGHYVRRTQSSDAHQDGVATFWLAGRWTTALPVREVPYQTNAFLDRDNVGLVVPLTEVSSDADPARPPRSLIVANTHLLFNPKRGTIKLGQIHKLLAAVASVAADLSSPATPDTPPLAPPPVVVCGDMNSALNSATLQLLTTGQVDLSAPEELLSGQAAGRPNAGSYADIFGHPPALTPALTAQKADVKGWQVPRFLTHPLDLASAYPDAMLVDRVSSVHPRTRDLVDFITFGTVPVNGPSVAEVEGPPRSAHASRWVPATWHETLGDEPGSRPPFPPGRTPKQSVIRKRAMGDAAAASIGNDWVPAAAATAAVPHWELVPTQVLELPRVSRARPMPNDEEGSDHLSLVADFAFAWVEGGAE